MKSEEIHVHKSGLMARKKINFLLIVFFCITIYCVIWMKTIREERKVNMKELLIDGITLLHKAGSQIVEFRKNSQLNSKVKGETKEGKKELLTKADISSHNIITNSLKHHYKHLKIISEEHDTSNERPFDINLDPAIINQVNNIIDSTQDHTYNADHLLVWVDPLDATQEYTESLTEYVTVMLCVAYNDRPILGIIHQPFQETTYWAYNNKNTRYISWKESINRNVTPSFIVSRSHAGEVQKIVSKAFIGGSIVPAGGAGYKAINVITNSSLTYIHTTNIKKWDICAPDAIVSISGGRATDLKGNLIGYSDAKQVVNEDGVLITNKFHNHDDYLQKIRAVKDGG